MMRRRQRIPDMPQVPTFRQAGLDLVYDSWFGLMAPAGVPRDIINKINQDVVGILKTPELGARIKAQYALLITDTPEQFDRQIRDETAHLTEVFRDVTN